jgi:hypothetical protein
MDRLLWTQKQDIGPSARAGVAMTFDAKRQRTLLYGGGAATGASGETWEWDGAFWVQVQDIGPGPRASHAMEFDASRSRTVLFGGLVGNRLAVDAATWEWDGADWTQVADTGPAGRHATVMCFDVKRQRVILFGGALVDGTLLNDTWEWDGQDWTQLDDVGPSPRHAHAMCFDAHRGRTVLFGGSGRGALADTWERDGDHWAQVANAGPEPTVGATLTFRTGHSVLFGGMSDLGAPVPTIREGTWEWDGEHWTQRQNMGPPARAFHGASYDSGRRRVVVFGGTDVAIGAPDAGQHLFGDTWEHHVPDDEPGGGGQGEPGATLLVTPDPVRFGSTMTIRASLAAPSQTNAHLSVTLGKAARTIVVQAGQLDAVLPVVIDNSVIVPPVFGSSIDVVAHIGDRVLSRTVTVVP